MTEKLHPMEWRCPKCGALNHGAGRPSCLKCDLPPTRTGALARPVAARMTPTKPGVHCCAPGCGDKIKDYPVMCELRWSDGGTTYLEGGDCLTWFKDGHPDVGGGWGVDVPALVNKTLGIK